MVTIISRSCVMVLVVVCGALLLPEVVFASASVKIAWYANSEPDLAGYNVYHGTTPGIYSAPVNVNTATMYVKEGLARDANHYFAVTAYDFSGNESVPSDEVQVFIPGVKNTLVVSIEGNGHVTSTPAGIVCGTTCSGTFDEGEHVTLTAVPSANTVFSGWSGACAGLGPCQLTINGTMAVSAKFTASKGAPTPGAGDVTRVNFQPPDVATPPGYVRDTGATYSAARGYGWNRRLEHRVRDKLNDPTLDTFVFTSSSAATWNYAVPNGVYLVSLAAGDPAYDQGPHRISVEGNMLVNRVSTPVNEFVMVTNVPVTVSDNTLTVKLHGSSGNVLLNYLTFEPTDIADDTPLSPPDDPGKSLLSVDVNFQATEMPLTLGRVLDNGGVYTPEKGYGWSQALEHRERTSPNSYQLDTFVFVKRSSATWTYDLPNGTYLISLASGDSSYAQGAHRIVVEGRVVVDNVSTDINEFVAVEDVLVSVSDGALSLRLSSADGNAMLNYLTITEVQ